MRWMRPSPLRALEGDDDVPLALEAALDAAEAGGLRPADVGVVVGAVVHDVDRARARRAAADLAEDDLAVGLAVPLHVGEAGLEAERLRAPRGPSSRPPARSGTSSSRRQTVCGLIHSFWRWMSGRGRYQQTFSKNILPPAQMVSKVNSSASMNSSTETSWTCLESFRARSSSARRVAAVGVGRAGAGDRLDDHRIADPLGGVAHLVLGVGAEVARRADAGGVERAAS